MKNRYLILCVLFVCVSCGRITNRAVATEQDHCQEQITLVEIPRVLDARPQQIIEHTGYTVSHNPVWNIPNWVAYSLSDTELQGDIPRAKHFYPDPEVQGVAVVTKDYAHSGYDRGHMAPAADMKWSEQAMRESFYMTNICPQNRNLNRGDWNDLEELARDWARKYGEIYIVCGPLIFENYKTIGQNKKIAIPDAFYKVFLRKTTTSWTTIGFVMPNQAGNSPLMTYMLSIDEIEELSGIDFFYSLPDDIEDYLENDFNTSEWTI